MTKRKQLIYEATVTNTLTMRNERVYFGVADVITLSRRYFKP